MRRVPPAPTARFDWTPYPEQQELANTRDLPPAVTIWRETDVATGDLTYALVEQLPFTPTRFILRRGYASEAEARANAWDELERHQAVRRIAAQSHERANERNRRGTANERDML